MQYTYLFGAKAERPSKIFSYLTYQPALDRLHICCQYKGTGNTEVLKINYLDIVTNCLDKIKHYCADFVHCIISVNNLVLIRVCLVPHRCTEMLSHLAAVGGTSASFTNFSFYPLWFQGSVGRGAAGPEKCPLQSNPALSEQCCLTCTGTVQSKSKACSRVGTPVMP